MDKRFPVPAFWLVQMSRLSPVAAAGLCLCGAVLAAGALFDINYKADKSRATIGDEIKITVGVLHGSDYQLLPPPRDLDLKPFELKSIRSFEPRSARGVTSAGFEMVLTVFELGDLKIPGIPVRFVDPGRKPGVVYTKEWPVRVVSVLKKTDPETLKPLKGQRSLAWTAEALRRLWIWPAALAAAILSALLAKRLWGLAVAWRESRRTPAERALRALERLKARGVTAEGRLRELYEGTVLIVKNYLRDQFGLGTGDLTTLQYLEVIGRSGCLEPILPFLTELLSESDFVKFARLKPEASRVEKFLDLAKKIILEGSRLARERARSSGEAAS